MTTNTLNKPVDPELESQETTEEVELQWPESKNSVDDAILLAYKTWVLRFILSNLATPSKVLTAMRRLEVMKEFPLRVEKQARTLSMAEARIELRRRALDLKAAQIAESKAKREAAAAKAAAIAESRAAKAAEKAARANAKAQSVTKPAPAAPAPVPIQKAEVINKSPIEAPKPEIQVRTASPAKTELPNAYQASLIQLDQRDAGLIEAKRLDKLQALITSQI